MYPTVQLYQIFLQNPVVSTDSRNIPKGAIFFALKGANFDGNTFALQALEQGASYAVIDNPAFANDPRCLLTDDVLSTLQRLATHHRRQFDIPVIGITGSNGKTTTKELISAVLSSQYPTHYTRGNLNNHIGVPLTLLRMPFDTEIAVIEMGANHKGEIAMLSEIAEPTHGMITNIGKAHLEGFGGVEGIKIGKSELYAFLATHGGLGFINQNEPFLADLAQWRGLDRILFYASSDSPHPDNHPYEIQLLRETPFLQVGFLSETGDFTIADTCLSGSYNFNNVMSAVAIGKYFKVPSEKIKHAIETYVPSDNRSQLLTRGTNTFFLDAYNANPTSMRFALDAFCSMQGNPKIAIIGAMLELGADSEAEHEAIVQHALASDALQQIVLVGQGFHHCAEKYQLPYFENVDGLKPWFEARNYDHALIFLKGSRANKLESLVQ